MSSLPILSGSRSRFAPAALCAAVSFFLAACSGGGSGGGDAADTTPPAAPSGLGATTASGTQINLAWTASTDNVAVTGYRVERCQGAGCANFAQVATPATTSFNDAGLSDATSYSYRVRAADAAGNLGAYSNTASVTTPDTTPPAAPTSLSATASSQTQINLTWTAATDNVGVTGYRVERCQGASCNTFTEIATPTTASFNDTGLTAGTSYSYRARAADAAVNLGPYSNIASATTLPPTPAAPTGVSAAPGNTQVLLSWPAVAGATSYNVYSSATAPATTAGTKTTVPTPGATLSPLTNGTPIYAAVTAVNAGGESALSNQVCGVPTAADTTGLTLYDPLCGDTLDGMKWQTPLFSRGVANNAMVLSSQIANMESRQVKFISYQTLMNVNTASRVSTLTADITVPASSASRAANAEIRAIMRIVYQPPANRLQFPGGNLDQLLMEVGLMDNGSGLKAVRNFRHCDNASCSVRSTTGIAFSADPTGFTTTSTGQTEAPAVYDTTYTVSISLDESTGVLTWSFAGGAFGAGVPGTADPTVYLGSNANWTGILLAGTGFSVAQLGARVVDDSVSGGSAGSVAGRFANVHVGLNNAAATLWDDFSGTAANSGPTELRLDKWTQPGGPSGRNSMALNAGSLTGHIQSTSLNTGGFSASQAITFNNPAAINTMQADVNVSTCANSVGGPLSDRVQLQGDFYNDGSLGANVAPDINQPNSAVGDVRAFLMLDCKTGQATFQIGHFITQTTLGPPMFNPANNVVANLPGPVTGTHTLTLKWDPTTHAFTFQVDGTGITVDPTTVNARMNIAAPFVKPANSPTKQLAWVTFVPPATPIGSTASLDFKVNNVFTAP